MNQEKIGKFIAQKRKEKKMTQVELGSKLGVTDRSVSKWENGKCMPDLSLFEPLCKELEIKVNELLSGEEIASDDFQSISEENLINTLDYANRKLIDKNHRVGIIFLVLGFFIVLSAISIFPSVSSWSSIYSIFGVLVALIGFLMFTKKLEPLKRVLLNFGFLILSISLLFILDYSNVVINKQAPRFSYRILTTENTIYYQTPFYNVFKINADTNNEYYIIDDRQEYEMDTVPVSPFNREVSGIENLINYKFSYLGNNSNTGNLINSLPLSEFGYVFQIDPINFGLAIDYHTTDWYNNENNYIQSALVYNSVSIFMLIDNIETITYNFSGNSYSIKRSDIEEKYSNYELVINNTIIDIEKFNEYVEKPMNEEHFVIGMFSKLFE